MASINTKSVRFNQTFLDESLEHACEIETQLAEYLPDIKQVVRVDAKPLISEIVSDNGILEIKGRVDVIVLYMPEEGTLQSHHCRLPFSTGLSGKSCPADARFVGKVRMDSVTCRPLSGRKLELRCIVALGIQGEGTGEVEIVSPTAEEKTALECLIIEQSVGVCLDHVRDEFTVEEMIELPENSARMDRIIKCDVDAYPLERRVANGKAIISGELVVSCLYLSDIDHGMMEQFTTEIPFNRVVELSALEEGDEISVTYDVVDTAYGVLEDTAGEDRILSLKAGLCAMVRAYRNQKVKTVNDAYGKNLNVDIKRQDWTVEEICGIESCNIKLTESFTPKEAISAVYSAEAYADVKSVALEESKLRFQGDLLVSFLVRMEDGDCAGLDHLVPFDTICDQDLPAFGSGSYSGSCRLTNFSYQVTLGGAIQVEAKLGCMATARVRKRIPVAESIETQEVEASVTNKCLTLYYPVEGESLWDIGKRYTTPIAEIMAANALEDQEILQEVKMLLIPR